MEKLKSKFSNNKRGAFFLKYFVILAVIIVIGFIITGITLMAFVYNFSKQETLAGLSKNSIAISDFTSEILCSDLALHNQEATALLFYNNLKLTADASGSMVFMCNADGMIIACDDTLKKPFETVKHAVCEEHKNIHIPKAIL